MENISGRIVLHDLDYAKKTASNNLLLTVFGYVPCGSPNFIDDNIEGFLEIPKSMLGQGDFFVLRAKGDSMVDAGIKTGDLIIIKRQPTAEDGQIVVARLGNNVTLKNTTSWKQQKRLCFIQKTKITKILLLEIVTLWA